MSLSRTQVNILRGAATVLVLFPPMQVIRYSIQITPLYSPAKSGMDALRGDWIKIGTDIQESLVKEINDRGST